MPSVEACRWVITRARFRTIYTMCRKWLMSLLVLSCSDMTASCSYRVTYTSRRSRYHYYSLAYDNAILPRALIFINVITCTDEILYRCDHSEDSSDNSRWERELALQFVSSYKHSHMSFLRKKLIWQWHWNNQSILNITQSMVGLQETWRTVRCTWTSYALRCFTDASPQCNPLECFLHFPLFLSCFLLFSSFSIITCCLLTVILIDLLCG